jgi:Fur family transcriptional regulator, peroxide stress response regulator
VINPTQLKEQLEEKGIRASHQRLRIYQELMQSVSHPSAEQLYQMLSKEMPSLSRTTVYNTLSLFVQMQLVKGITIESNEMRYDALMSEHGHFKCVCCGSVSNFCIAIDVDGCQELAGCKVMEKDVYIKGICGACKDKN